MGRFSPRPDQIESWVSRHFEHKKRPSGDWLRINSPFDGDTGFNFNISTKTARCHDWRGDDWAGRPSPKTGKRNCSFVHFVMLFLKCDFHVAKKAIQEASKEVDRPDGRLEIPEVAEKPTVALPYGSERLWESNDTLSAKLARNWLSCRHIDATMIEKYKIHFCDNDVVWPYFEYGTLVYYQTRNILERVFRFPSNDLFGVSKGEFLYNFDNIEKARYVIVTEAIIKCLAIEDQAVAIGGADLTHRQIAKLSLLRPSEGVILAPDNDAAGIKSILRNGRELQSRGFKVCFSIPPKIQVKDALSGESKMSKDWDDLLSVMSRAELCQIIERNIKLLSLGETAKLAKMLSG